MENKDLIEKSIKVNGYTIGCYDLKIEKLDKSEIKKIIEAVEFYDSTDVSVSLNNQEYVVEVFSVDNEMDFNLMSRKEYNETYGV